MIIYETDGSFQGFLTAVFESYVRKHTTVYIIDSLHSHTPIFDEYLQIQSDAERAERVWNGLQKHLTHSQLREIYVAYLSEIPTIINDLYYVVRKIFDVGAATYNNFGDERILNVRQTIRRVEREKHRMKAFVRFKKSNNGLYYALIEPDFNVLPLIATFFKNRYADQQWMIYDTKRKYGLHYDLQSLTEIVLDELPKSQIPTTVGIDTDEELYNTLWKDYFKSTNIVARKNTKLHLRHVPKRYWKYLTEKQLSKEYF